MLDVSIRLGVLNLLGDLRDARRLAILYITHDIASARYLADTIAVMYAGQVVEAGPAQAVTDEPAHPYTQLLLSAAPDPDRAGQAPVGWAPGAPPSLLAPPRGCRFHPRCPHAMAICAEHRPAGLRRGRRSRAAPAGCTRRTWTPATGQTRSPRTIPHPTRERRRDEPGHPVAAQIRR